MKILICCNKNDIELHLQRLCGKENIIPSLTDLESILIQNAYIGGIIVYSELKWEHHKLSTFYGFDLLCVFRTEYRLKCPIAICSFMPEPWLRKKFPILDFPQHHPFIHLPASPDAFIEKIEKAEVADEPRLNDIIISYCDLKGRLIKLITHGKGFRQITRNAGVNNGYDSLWSDCYDDLALLRSYLSNRALGKTVLSIGFEVEAKLQKAITEKNLDNLLVTKPIFDRFMNELANMKGIPFIY